MWQRHRLLASSSDATLAMPPEEEDAGDGGIGSQYHGQTDGRHDAAQEGSQADAVEVTTLVDATGIGDGEVSSVASDGAAATRQTVRRHSRDGADEQVLMRWYDAVFDMPAISHIVSGGWTLRLSPWARAATATAAASNHR